MMLVFKSVTSASCLSCCSVIRVKRPNMYSAKRGFGLARLGLFWRGASGLTLLLFARVWQV